MLMNMPHAGFIKYIGMPTAAGIFGQKKNFNLNVYLKYTYLETLKEILNLSVISKPS